jgi:hypothetical protein
VWFVYAVGRHSEFQAWIRIEYTKNWMANSWLRGPRFKQLSKKHARGHSKASISAILHPSHLQEISKISVALNMIMTVHKLTIDEEMKPETRASTALSGH